MKYCMLHYVKSYCFDDEDDDEQKCNINLKRQTQNISMNEFAFQLRLYQDRPILDHLSNIISAIFTESFV